MSEGRVICACGTGTRPSAITWARKECAATLVRQGFSVPEAARQNDLSAAELQAWIDMKLAAAQSVAPEPGFHYDAAVLKLIEGHRAGNYIAIDCDQYKRCVRPLLLASTDPSAAALLSVLDRRFNI